MAGLSLDIKYIFLSFAQQYFKDSVSQSKYNWDPDVTKTKIVIADKYAIDLGVAVKRPSIILSRGGFGWSNIYRNEGSPPDDFFRERNVPYGSADWKRNKKFTDLLSGTITYNVIAKNGVQAEEIADQLYIALTGYRDVLKKKGIHKVQNLTMSDERVVKQGSEIELQAVSISLSFLSQKSVALSDKQYNIRVWINDVEQLEGIDFRVPPDGTTIEFKCAPETGDEILMNYVDAVSLDEVTGVSPVESPDGDRTIFTIPNSGSIYGYYKILSDIIITEADEGEWVNVD